MQIFVTKYLSVLREALGIIWKVVRIISGISAIAVFAWFLRLELLLDNVDSLGGGMLLMYGLILTGIAWGKRGLMFLGKFCVLFIVVAVLKVLIIRLIINPLLLISHTNIDKISTSDILLLVQIIAAATLVVIWNSYNQAKLSKSKKKK